MPGQVIGEAFVRVAPDLDGFASTAESETRAAADGMGTVLKTALLGAGLLAGAALVKGLGEALAQDKAVDLMAAQLGATPAEAEKYGKVAGRLFTSAVTEDFAQGADAIRGVMQQGLAPPEATEAQLESISTRLVDVATLLGEDVTKATGAVATMMKTGLAPDAQTALDILTKGAQGGANKAEDLLDTFTEYPTVFASLGLDAQTAMGLLQQGLQGGARDSDFLADALKEFGIRAIDGSKASAEAFAALGLNAEEMTAKIARGGDDAAGGLQTVLDRLRGMQDPVERNAAAVGLFGTKAEDLAGALFTLDPKTATQSLGDFAGAAEKAGDTMRDNASTEVEQFKRAVSQAFVEFLGDKALPVLKDVAKYLDEHFGPALSALATFIRDDLVPAFTTAKQWIEDNKEPLLAIATAITIVLLPALAAAAIGAVTSAATQVAAWVTTSATATTSAATSVAAHWSTIGGWIAAGVQAAIGAAKVVASWVLMAAQATARAIQMAAAWVIALGPIAWVTVAVAAIVALVIYYWDEIVAGTKAAWTWVKDNTVGLVRAMWDWLKGAWSSAIGWLGDKTGAIKDKIVGGFTSMKDGAIEKARALIDWVRGIPGEIKGALGDVGRMLYDSGRAIIQGLIDGLGSMAGAVRDKVGGILSGARDMLPFSPAKEGPFSGRGWTTYSGASIIDGLIEGISSRSPALEAAMAGALAGAHPVAAPTAAAAAAAPTAANGGGRAGVHIEHWHSGGESPDEIAAALDWRARGMG